MKFMHLGDLHLGKILLDCDLKDDQRYILDKLLDMAKTEAVDGVLIAGDVYDKAIPSEAAVNLLNDFLCGLAEMKVKVFMISGNHDSDDRLNFGSRLFESNQIFISSGFDGRLHRHTMEDGWGEVDIFLLPFVKASQVRHYYPDAAIRTYEDAVRTILKDVDTDTENRRRVLVAHQFVAGRSEDPYLAGSESIGTQSVGLVEKIGYDCFDAFDYVALGHIHSPQRVGRDEVRYSGSPLKYSLSEVNNEKSVPIVTLGEKGDVKVKLITLAPRREMRHLRGELKELLQKGRSDARYARDDYIYATLTDETFISDAIGIIRNVYPNTLKLDYDNTYTRKIQQADISSITENKSFPELISDFYRLIYGCDISKEEMAVMVAVAKEAGVIHEAD
jgi:exonuclease SbcD